MSENEVGPSRDWFGNCHIVPRKYIWGRESGGTHSFPAGCLTSTWLHKESLGALHLGLFSFQWSQAHFFPSIWILPLSYSSNTLPLKHSNASPSPAQDPSPYRVCLWASWMSLHPQSLTSTMTFSVSSALKWIHSFFLSFFYLYKCIMYIRIMYIRICVCHLWVFACLGCT